MSETNNNFEQEDFEKLLNEAEENQQNVRPGEIVTGEVLDVKEDEIILNIGYKMDGVISLREYTSDPTVTDLTKVVNVGDKIDAKIIKIDENSGQVVMSYRKMLQDRGNEKLKEAFEQGTTLTAPVTKVLSGGLSVTVEDTRVFIPASLVSDTYVKDLNEYAGKEISFRITEFNPRRRRIIGDRKVLIQEEKQQNSESPQRRPSVAEERQRNADDRRQAQHHADIDKEME